MATINGATLTQNNTIGLDIYKSLFNITNINGIDTFLLNVGNNEDVLGNKIYDEHIVDIEKKYIDCPTTGKIKTLLPKSIRDNDDIDVKIIYNDKNTYWKKYEDTLETLKENVDWISTDSEFLSISLDSGSQLSEILLYNGTK